jgi:hypothetical protein
MDARAMRVVATEIALAWAPTLGGVEACHYAAAAVASIAFDGRDIYGIVFRRAIEAARTTHHLRMTDDEVDALAAVAARIWGARERAERSAA